jgi:hypothetical protein
MKQANNDERDALEAAGWKKSLDARAIVNPNPQLNRVAI